MPNKGYGNFTNTVTNVNTSEVIDKSNYQTDDSLANIVYDDDDYGTSSGTIPFDPSEYNISVTDLTDNVQREGTSSDNYIVTGSGILDVLMNTATIHLQTQFDRGSIRGEDYANAYIQIYASTLNASVQLLVESVRIKSALLTEEENRLNLEAQRRMIEAQRRSVNAQRIQTYIENKHIEAQKELVKAQIISETAKKLLYDRQRKGFDEDSQQKVLKHLTELWSVAFTVAGTNNDVKLPTTVTSDSLETAMREVAKNTGLDIYGDGG